MESVSLRSLVGVARNPIGSNRLKAGPEMYVPIQILRFEWFKSNEWAMHASK